MSEAPASTMSCGISLEEAKRSARDTVKRSGTSFFHAMRILPKPRREAMYAVYAYCRTIDDIADDEAPVEQKRVALAGWRDEIARLYAGRPTCPVACALQEPVERFDLPSGEFELLLEGMEMDVNGPVRAPTMVELLRYTRCVAGAVGMLSMRIFGAPENETADSFALNLADALQLTNILRDLGEDAVDGRLYLPRELLHEHGIRSSEPNEVLQATGLQHVCRDLASLSRSRFAEARRALRSLDHAPLRPALMMMGIYESYLTRLEQRGWEHVGDKVRLSKLEKLAISARYALAPPLNP